MESGSQFLFRIEDPSRNRLASTAYFVCMHQNQFFFKIGQIYIKDTECAESKEKSYIRFFQFYFSSMVYCKKNSQQIFLFEKDLVSPRNFKIKLC